MDNYNTLTLAGVRVVFVLGTLEMGGAERQALYLAEYLAKEKKAQVQVWGMSLPGLAAKRCDELGIPWRIVPFRWPCRKFTLLKTLPRFALSLRRARPDVVLPYTRWANVPCGLTWRLAGAQTCIWGQRSLDYDQSKTDLERYAAKLTPLMIANSVCAKDFLTGTLKVSSKKIHVIHNGVELTHQPRARKIWRQKLGITDQSFVACMVANFRYPKDHAAIVRAWRTVVDHITAKRLKAYLIFAGVSLNKPSGDAQVRSIVEKLGLELYVKFVGQTMDISGLIKAADIGILSSLSESSPNGLLECMAAELPVLGTDIPGILEALGHRGNGLLSLPHDATTMAKNIIRLIENPQKRIILGQQNRRRVAEKFSIQEMLSKTTKLITTELQKSLA